jgi:hypothetical protein
MFYCRKLMNNFIKHALNRIIFIKMMNKDETGRVAYKGEESSVYNSLIGKSERKKHFNIIG